MLVPIRIEVEAGERVVLDWEDGTRQVATAARLRESCPCAGCREVASKGMAVVADPLVVKVTGAELVGDYAINFTFDPDGHHTGIYSFDLLRALQV